jgi:spore coat protein U-like protein
MSRKLLMAATGAAALFAAAPAWAQSASENIIVSLKVDPTCSINVNQLLSGSLAFPTVQTAGALQGDIDAQTTTSGAGGINVECNTASGVPMFAIGTGANDSGGVRRLRNISSGQLVPYRLYADAARSSAFEFTPDGTKRAVNGGSPVTPNVAFDIVVYGRISKADVTSGLDAGDLDDTVLGTLSF